MSEQQFEHLLDYLQKHAKEQPDAIAIRQKQLGLWRQWSWHKLFQKTQHYAVSLQQLGFQKGDQLLVLASPHIDVIALSFAVQTLAGTVQLFEAEFDFDHVERLQQIKQQLSPQFILVDEFEQAKQLSQLKGNKPFIFYIDDFSHVYDHFENIISIAQLEALIKQDDEHSIHLQHVTQNIAFNFVKVVDQHYLSAEFEHQNLILEAKSLIEKYQFDANEQAFIARAFSSVGHIRYLWSSWLVAGFTLNIPESLETRDHDRKLIAPTLVLGTKQTFERVHSLIKSRLPSEKSWLFKAFQISLVESSSRSTLSVTQKIAYSVFKQVILAEIGFSRLKTALIVGEPISEESRSFYQALNIELQYWEDHTQWVETNIQNTNEFHSTHLDLNKKNSSETYSLITDSIKTNPITGYSKVNPIFP